jgi:uncharacterized membrane protein
VSSAARPARAIAAERARLVSIVAIAGIAACVVLGAVRTTSGWPALWLALALVAPVLLPLPGILRRDRRTFAWATLCVTPYLIYGITETIANPGARAIAEAVLLGGIVLFWALVAFLRLTRPPPGGAQGS